jgi:hypothetical protein
MKRDRDARPAGGGARGKNEKYGDREEFEAMYGKS